MEKKVRLAFKMTHFTRTVVENWNQKTERRYGIRRVEVAKKTRGGEERTTDCRVWPLRRIGDPLCW